MMRSDSKLGLQVVALIFLLLGLLWSQQSRSEEDPAKADTPKLENRIQSLKNEVLDLNRDLFLLEEDLLFPANTQFSVFVSVDVGDYFSLDSIQLKLDDKVVANHLYTEREIQALKRGGVQRLYIGNIAAGSHELVAFFTGKGPHNRDYRRGTSVKLEKTTEPQFVELKVVDSSSKEQPEFATKVWD